MIQSQSQINPKCPSYSYFVRCDTDTASIARCVTHLYDIILYNIGPLQHIILAHDPNVLEARTDF